VALVGAGNAHDVPLTRLAERATSVDLVDLDRRAAAAARRRKPTVLRKKIAVVPEDVTDGGADLVARAAAAARDPRLDLPAPKPLGRADYDLVVGDLFYSQLIYPGLKDLGLQERRIGTIMREVGPALVDHVVTRLQLSAPRGHVVHVHDPLGWWNDHEQPVALEEILAAAERDAAAALELVARGFGPTASDPRESLARLGIPVLETRFSRWPFQDDVEYLVCTSVTEGGMRTSLNMLK
jgi:hypothetical protein